MKIIKKDRKTYPFVILYIYCWIKKTGKEVKSEEDFITKNATQCGKGNEKLLWEYDNEFACYICGLMEEKQKNQLTKIQRRKNTNL